MSGGSLFLSFPCRLGAAGFPSFRRQVRNHQQSAKSVRISFYERPKEDQVFRGYCEGTLSFKPTYKYNVGSSNYDTSYKVRVPSWTDRILFKIDSSSRIDAVLHSYESVDQISSSDHKPVKAHLCLRLNN